MRVWIDATGANHALRVFGMSLLERLLRGLRASGARLSEVRVELPDGESAAGFLPDGLTAALPLRWSCGNAPLARRLQCALEDAAGEPLLALAADSVVDTRVIEQLAETTGSMAFIGAARGDAGAGGVVMRLEHELPQLSEEDADLLAIARRAIGSGGVAQLKDGDFDGYITDLRRALPPYVLHLSGASDCPRVERFLFWSNYKGSTDFMTRYVYPPLVWLLVRPLARWRVHPHWVTSVDIVATAAAIPCFAAGAWVPGFGFAYLMSVLDSVDGKLARLTFSSSRLGEILDHGLDVIHPPFWYLAWGWALSHGDAAAAPYLAAKCMFGLYAADRLLALLFKTRTGRSIHGFTALDAKMRTFISRRNVHLPVFMAALLVDWIAPGLRAAEYTFYAIVAWQALCLVFHAERVARFWNARTHRASPVPGSEGPRGLVSRLLSI